MHDYNAPSCLQEATLLYLFGHKATRDNWQRVGPHFACLDGGNLDYRRSDRHPSTGLICLVRAGQDGVDMLIYSESVCSNVPAEIDDSSDHVTRYQHGISPQSTARWRHCSGWSRARTPRGIVHYFLSLFPTVPFLPQHQDICLILICFFPPFQD